ncbi:MAG: zinc ribbon domain-containing protein [Gemmatimonadales bacterium]
MPTYDYQCSSGHNFEKIHKMSESPRVKCPICGKPAARQISGGAGLVFKGSGFYITDYGKDGKGARKADTGEGAGSSPAKPDAAAPATPAKPESKSGKDAGSKSGSGSKKAAE